MEIDMSEPIKLYRDGEMIETVSPSVAREWMAQGWSKTPDTMPNVAPDELPELAQPAEGETPFPFEVDPSHWAGDMMNYKEPEPVQRKPGRPKKTT